MRTETRHGKSFAAPEYRFKCALEPIQILRANLLDAFCVASSSALD